MEKPKIAFDVDGVLGDFLYQYSRYHKKIYPDSGIDFRMITDYGVPAACGILWSLPGFYESMPVMEGAKELVREFAEVCEMCYGYTCICEKGEKGLVTAAVSRNRRVENPFCRCL